MTERDPNETSEAAWLQKPLDHIQSFLKSHLDAVWTKRLCSFHSQDIQSAIPGVLMWPLALVMAIAMSAVFIMRQVVNALNAFWRKLTEEPINALVFLLVVCALSAVLLAGILRWSKSETTVIISAFELTTARPKVLPITGKTAANILKDEIKRILDGSRGEPDIASGEEERNSRDLSHASEKGQLSARSVDLEEMSEVSGVGIEVEGISFEKIVGLFESIRQEQRHVEGDVIFSGALDNDGPRLQLVDSEPLANHCQLLLQARISKIGDWKTSSHSCNADGLQGAARELAQMLMADLSPHTLAIYLQSEGQNEEEIQILRGLIAREPENVQSRVDLAAALENSGDSLGAITEYRTALALGPKRLDDVHYRLGLSLFNSEQIEEAESQFRDAIRLNRNFAPPHYGLAKQMDYLGNQSGAMKEYRAALEIDDGDALAHDYYGLALDRNWQTDEAIRQFREAVRLNPNNPGFHQDLAIELDIRGNLEEAVTEYREFVRLRPKSAWAHTNLGYALGRLGKYDEAIKEHQRALVISGAESNKELPDAHNNLGVAYEAQGNDDAAIKEYGNAIGVKEYENAIKDLDKAKESKSASYLAWGNLALVYSRKGDLKKFYDYLNFSTISAPDDDRAKAYRRAGDEFKAIGDLEAAISNYQFALYCCPPAEPDTYIGLGYALDEAGDEQGALEALYSAMRLRDDSSVHLAIGTILENTGRNNEALEQYRAALRRDPDNPDIHRSLANQFVEHGDYDSARREQDDAISGYKDALLKQPFDANASWNLGNIMAESGDSRRAVELLQKARDIQPNRPLLYNDLGSALEQWYRFDENLPDWDGQEQAITEYRAGAAAGSRLAHTNLAYALDLEGKHEEAIQEYLSILGRMKDDIPAHLGLGMAYENARRYTEAIAEYRTAIDRNRKVGGTTEEDDFSGAHSGLCSALNKTGEYLEAMKECALSLQQEPGNAEAHVNMGDSIKNQSLHCGYCWSSWLRRQAIKEYQTAARIAGEGLRFKPDAETFVTLARANLGMGRNQEAIDQLRMALKWKPIYPMAHYYLGIAFRGSGGVDSAHQQFEESAQ